MEHAQPFRSALIGYLDEIRHLRRARHTWRAIAEHLTNNRGVPITASGVHIFFKRATRRKKLPLGFEDPVTAEPIECPKTVPARSSIEEVPQHRKAAGRRISVIPISESKQHPWFGSWEPDRGINYVPKDQ
jgi:hypothetical protein